MMSSYKYMSAGLVALLLGSGQILAADAPQVVELTQIPCQFIESENGVDHGYQSASADDCVAVNDSTGKSRIQQAKVLNLSPGKYIFRVTNKNVPYELGFWLRGAGLIGYATLPSVSGGGLALGKTQDYLIELKAGEYVYSCPLNPTPDYHLSVSE